MSAEHIEKLIVLTAITVTTNKNANYRVFIDSDIF